MQAVEQKKHFVAALNLTGASRKKLAMFAGQFNGFPQVAPVLAVRGAYLALHDGKQAEIDLRLSFADEAQARKAGAALTESLTDKLATNLPTRVQATFKSMAAQFHNTMVEIRGADVVLATGVARTDRKFEAP